VKKETRNSWRIFSTFEVNWWPLCTLFFAIALTKLLSYKKVFGPTYLSAYPEWRIKSQSNNCHRKKGAFFTGLCHLADWMAGLPDYSGCNITRQGKIYQMAIKVDQIAIKYANIFHRKTLQNLTK
jgi:hypothetical protein